MESCAELIIILQVIMMCSTGNVFGLLMRTRDSYCVVY